MCSSSSLPRFHLITLHEATRLPYYFNLFIFHQQRNIFLFYFRDSSLLLNSLVFCALHKLVLIRRNEKMYNLQQSRESTSSCGEAQGPTTNSSLKRFYNVGTRCFFFRKPNISIFFSALASFFRFFQKQLSRWSSNDAKGREERVLLLLQRLSSVFGKRENLKPKRKKENLCKLQSLPFCAIY